MSSAQGIDLADVLADFLDCRYGERTKCRLTAGQLARQGFADVTVVLR